MNKRIKEVREKLDLSMRAFGDRLHMSSGAVSMIENGQRAVTDRFIYMVCAEFNVNENWLRTGDGNMFDPLSWEQEVAAISYQIFSDDNADRRNLVNIVANLTDEQIDVLHEIAKKWLENNK